MDWFLGEVSEALFGGGADFEAEVDSELTVVSGEELEVVADEGDGWLLVRHGSTGKTGLVPTDYCEFL